MKGKERIKKALVGLVLLMGAYVILNTVSPQIVRLELPATPMVKQITLLDESKDCVVLEKQEYQLGDAVAGKLGINFCGATRPVLKDPNGVAVAAGAICQVRECPGEGARCAGRGDKAACVKCEDVSGSISGSSTKLSASQAVCDDLSGGPTYAKGPDNKDVLATVSECWYSKDNSVAFDVALGTCAAATIDCSKIKTCSDYDKIKVKGSALTSSTLDQIEARPSLEVPLFKSVTDRVNIESVCQSDPCQWHRDDTGEDKTTRCQLYERAGDDCLTASQYTTRNESTDTSAPSGAQRFE